MYISKLLSKFLIRMSLAIFAASINDDSNITDNLNKNDNIIKMKRHQKTQRIYPKLENFDTNKVNSVIQQIHTNLNDDEDEENNYDNYNNFNPPPNPTSSGVEKTRLKNNDIKNNNVENNKEEFVVYNNLNTLGKSPQPVLDDNLHLNDYNNYGNEKTNEDYYKKILPSYNSLNQNTINPINPINRQYYNNNSTLQQNPINNQNDLLLQKLNYMISLLEENQDEKTNNVTEEVILYSFLGIFMIFLVDSFVRVGKYVR